MANVNNTTNNKLINGTTDADEIINSGSRVTINADGGDDSIVLEIYAEGNLIEYSAGDGNDKIEGFDENDTLNISDGVYSSQVSGSDVLVTVSDGVITLAGATSLSALNIFGKSDTLTVTDKTSSPVTIDSDIKVVDASARTTAFEFYDDGI